MTLENAAETLLEIQHSGGCQAIYHAINEEDIERIMKYPFTMIGSDGEVPQFGVGSPHPRSYGTFARVLARYVRERHTISLEEAVHKMSGLPAQRLKLYDRGLIRPGMKADVVVFDPAKVEDKATFEKPHQYAGRIRGLRDQWQGAHRGRRADERTIRADLIWSRQRVARCQSDRASGKRRLARDIRKRFFWRRFRETDLVSQSTVFQFHRGT